MRCFKRRKWHLQLLLLLALLVEEMRTQHVIFVLQTLYRAQHKAQSGLSSISWHVVTLCVKDLRSCSWGCLRGELVLWACLSLSSVDREARACELFCFKAMSFCYFIGQSGTVSDLYPRVLILGPLVFSLCDRWARSGVMWLWPGCRTSFFPLTSLESSCQLQGSAFNSPT